MYLNLLNEANEVLIFKTGDEKNHFPTTKLYDGIETLKFKKGAV